MDVKVEYFGIDGVAGRYFFCPAYKVTMSVASCASSYKAEKQTRYGRHMLCKGCPIGAAHANERPVAVRSVYGSLLCPRCQRSAIRLVRGVCVSCVNRQYEVIKGVNAKGRPPTRVAPLAPMRIVSVEHTSAVLVSTALASGRLEVVLRTLRERREVVGFSRRSSSFGALSLCRGALFAQQSVMV